MAGGRCPEVGVTDVTAGERGCARCPKQPPAGSVRGNADPWYGDGAGRTAGRAGGVAEWAR